jgi:hypothetical protein
MVKIRTNTPAVIAVGIRVARRPERELEDSLLVSCVVDMMAGSQTARDAAGREEVIFRLDEGR